MRRPPVRERTVLVTGCSSGIGWATAHILRHRGWTVWPTARKPADLDRLRQAGFDPIPLDLADAASVAAATDTVLERAHHGLGGVVNNAGVGVPGFIESLSRDALRHQFEVNVLGLVDLTNRLIPTFRRQGWGRIVNVSSVLGRLTIPKMGAYCASKFALEAISDVWRVELASAGIGVSIIEPGPIATEFGQNALAQAERWLLQEDSPYRDLARAEIERQRSYRSRHRTWFERPPEDVARVIAHALESARPHRRYPVTVVAHLGAWAARWWPAAILDWLNIRSLTPPANPAPAGPSPK